jgi:hypothetical protein
VAHLAHDRLVLMVLDDLRWSDEATLELLSALVEPLGELSLLVLGAYRSDGLPRDHGVLRLRHELRRAGRLDEVTLGPLVPDEVAYCSRPRSAIGRLRRLCARSRTRLRGRRSSWRSSQAPFA